MKWKKAYLWVQTILVVLLVLMLSVSAIRIYQEGMEARANGQTMQWIYTREKVNERLAPIAPVFFFTLGMAVVGLILNVKDENADRPVIKAKYSRDGGKYPGRNTVKWVQIIILAAAVFFLVIGVMNDSARDVFIKAVNICSECIGLG